MRGGGGSSEEIESACKSGGARGGTCETLALSQKARGLPDVAGAAALYLPTYMDVQGMLAG